MTDATSLFLLAPAVALWLLSLILTLRLMKFRHPGAPLMPYLVGGAKIFRASNFQPSAKRIHRLFIVTFLAFTAYAFALGAFLIFMIRNEGGPVESFIQLEVPIQGQSNQGASGGNASPGVPSPRP